jgi:prepilin-type N-terminal cleavage/methylation domain-containing protein
MNNKKGFTLIELLVVIAIIGILSSVVLASLSTARNKAKDASARSELSSIRTQAEIYYGDHSSSYGTTGTDCTAAVFSDTQIQALKTRIESDTGHTLACNNTTTAWAAQIQLSGTSGAYVCVDSNGKVSEKTAAQTITDQACD